MGNVCYIIVFQGLLFSWHLENYYENVAISYIVKCVGVIFDNCMIPKYYQYSSQMLCFIIESNPNLLNISNYETFLKFELIEDF